MAHNINAGMRELENNCAGGMLRQTSASYCGCVCVRKKEKTTTNAYRQWQVSRQTMTDTQMTRDLHHVLLPSSVTCACAKKRLVWRMAVVDDHGYRYDMYTVILQYSLLSVRSTLYGVGIQSTGLKCTICIKQM